ncbi:MAG: zinc-dependent metalloprotease [Candidatus Azobacteroides sp.]|nr:zinc-dependent metalloprotease [Candidatus Azobacteroides sp.]
MLYSYCTFAQDFCSTNSNVPDFLQTISQNQLRSANADNSYVVRIFFHIIKRSNGTGGQTQTEVNTAFNTLQSDYQPYGISFELLGTDEIWNDNYYNVNINFSCNTNGNTDCDGDGKFNNFHPNSHTNAVDIYLFANDKLNSGLAAGIPASALVIGGNAYNINLASSHILSHEIGHCLGLYHTFHGLCEGGCAELVNGNNCSTCGDFVCDTPADPQMHQVNQNTCIWNGSTCSVSNKDANGDSYHPNTTLYMAYIAPNCMQQHTPGQVTRMKAMIANSPILQNVIVAPTLSGSTTLCLNSSATYTINNFPPNATVIWSQSSNLQQVSGSGASKIYKGIANGAGWIEATVNGITASRFNVWVGAPVISSIDGETSTIVNAVNRYYCITSAPTATTTFTWSGPPGGYRIVSAYLNSVDIIFTTSGQKWVDVVAGNTCGSQTSSKNVSVKQCQNPPCQVVQLSSAYPNPVDDVLNIEINGEAGAQIRSMEEQTITGSKTILQDATYDIRLYDGMGTLLRRATVKSGKVEFDVSNLADGIYYLHIYDGINEKPEMTQIIVQH